jgi:hypothetical protein
MPWTPVESTRGRMVCQNLTFSLLQWLHLAMQRLSKFASVRA